MIKWSEVWALLIPLAIIFIYPVKKTSIRLIVQYIAVAFILNLLATLIQIFHNQLPQNLRNNNIFYNLHSIARVLFFGLFMYKSGLLRFLPSRKIVLWIYLLFVLVNFILWENPFLLSSNLYAIESILLLTLSISFLLRLITDESETDWTRQPAFLVCTGIALYEVINFFIFLFFNVLKETNYAFGKVTMKIFSLSFVMLCVLMAAAIYRSRSRNSTGRIEPKTGPRTV